MVFRILNTVAPFVWQHLKYLLNEANVFVHVTFDKVLKNHASLSISRFKVRVKVKIH